MLFAKLVFFLFIYCVFGLVCIGIIIEEFVKVKDKKLYERIGNETWILGIFLWPPILLIFLLTVLIKSLVIGTIRIIELLTMILMDNKL